MLSQMIHWLALWLCDPQVAGLNPVRKVRVMRSRKIAHKNQQFFKSFSTLLLKFLKKRHERSVLVQAKFWVRKNVGDCCLIVHELFGAVYY